MLKDMKSKAMILGGLVALLWLIEIVNFLAGGALDQFGIVPRTWIGLRGIVLAPFIHGSFAHLIANTTPFVILGWLVLMRGTGEFVFACVCIMVVAGLGVWLTAGGNSIHFGASSVVFGLAGLLMARGYFERSLLSVLLSIGVGIAYGGILIGVLPGHPGISWQGHLFGFIGGVLASRVIAIRARATSAI